MKRIGMTWQVDPEKLEPYIDIHQNPWPDLLEAMQEVGVQNYNIFRFGNRMFAYLEVEDESALEELQKREVMDRWNEKVLPWVAPEAEEGSEVQFMELERIFYCP